MKINMFRFTALLFLSIFLSMGGCGYASEKGAVPAGSPAAPDFQLLDLAQNTHTLSSYKGKQGVILLFWTTWCPFCRQELRILANKYSQLMVDGWEVLAVNVGESAAKVDNFVKSYSLPFKVLFDKTTSVSRSFEVLGVPTYVFVDKEGKVIYVEHSFPDADYKALLPK